MTKNPWEQLSKLLAEKEKKPKEKPKEKKVTPKGKRNDKR